MLNINKSVKKLVKNIVEKEFEISANSTTCIVLYQPKAPTSLKKFNKIDNDK
ncbi:cyclic lactone autoinducer peptide [uncultured Eubacterium sp.]|uniref:cyclic lactone autoinducer peptide n=1 Tax=uncultured Eubacterium sp. TaxID=165185 RepID=UPI0026004523|nr:cyclic lactone autoinducer peptide [uncultured Eubacterium sp.]